jgi:DNA-binding NarL/FixJ family response regulator
MKTIRLLVVDDHAIVRAGLRALLETAEDMQVIGEAEDGQQAVREAKRLRPDVVLLDLAMPLFNGVEAARQIALEVPTARVLVLSSYDDAQHLRQAVEAGVDGYLIKESAANELLDAVRETANGGASFSPSLLRRLLTRWRGEPPNEPCGTTSTASLSGRQAQVLQLIAEGYCTKQIAGLLSVAEKTVEKHRQSLMGRLNRHNIATLTRYAVANGVVELIDTPGHTPEWPITAPALEKPSSVSTP